MNMLLYPFRPQIFCCSAYSSLKTPKFHSFSSSPNPSLHLKFYTSYRDNLRYLTTIGVINLEDKPHKSPSPENLLRILSTICFLKSKGFSDSHFARLAFAVPKLFSPEFDPADIQPVFDFLNHDLNASAEESCAIVVRCPYILESNVQFCLRPTLAYLTEIGVQNLNSPTNLNAHLLNTRLNKLQQKLNFLQSIGFSYEESGTICARFPAIFGYDIDNNLRPKIKYLLGNMGRSLDEFKRFPQYLGFSLERRIMPRHIHLRTRNVKIPLNRMLLCSDKKFYTKWK